MESRHFGALLRRHRMRVRMTQQQLADFSTLSVRAIRDLERGHAQRPRQDTVRLLAEVLRLGGHDREEFDLASRGVAEDLVAGRFTPPVPPATIVGREEELRVLTDLLTVEGQRLVAVVGVAGVGKTRLMLDVAGIVQHDAGWSVLWIPAPDLDAVSTAELVSLVGGHDTLLVVDGQAEAEIPPTLVELLHRCPQARLVVTAVAPGPITGAQVFPLAPLDVPAAGDEADLVAFAQVGSVRLITSQLRRFRPVFRLRGDNAAVVGGLCRALDGIPRALELVAAWCLVHTPEQLLEETRRNPFALAAPLMGAADLRVSMRRTLDAVEPALGTHLTRLAELDGTWSIPEAALLTGSRTADMARAVHALLIQGLVRCRADRFSVLNLVRLSHAEPARRRSEPAPPVTRPRRPSQTAGLLAR